MDNGSETQRDDLVQLLILEAEAIMEDALPEFVTTLPSIRRGRLARLQSMFAATAIAYNLLQTALKLETFTSGAPSSERET